jgi:hypothetical protein
VKRRKYRERQSALSVGLRSLTDSTLGVFGSSGRVGATGSPSLLGVRKSELSEARVYMTMLVSSPVLSEPKRCKPSVESSG